MSNEVVVETVSCPKCKEHTFLQSGIEKGIYSCTKPNCFGIALYCKKCEKVLPESMFGKHGDVYECKECGTVHWGYTDMIRNREEALRILMKANSSFDSILNRLK